MGLVPGLWVVKLGTLLFVFGTPTYLPTAPVLVGDCLIVWALLMTGWSFLVGWSSTLWQAVSLAELVDNVMGKPLPHSGSSSSTSSAVGRDSVSTLWQGG